LANGDHDWTAGETVTAANVDDYLQLQTKMEFATAAARNAALAARAREGTLTHQADSNSLTTYSGAAWSTTGPVHGALTAWTPVITQSNVPTLTNTASAYTRTGRWIQGYFNVSMTSSGTATNVITISLPVTAVGATVHFRLGIGNIFDTSAGFDYSGLLCLNSSTTMKYSIINTGVAPGYQGASGSLFTAALASGDILSGQFQYEAAADA
jgi:hypothetical protein